MKMYIRRQLCMTFIILMLILCAPLFMSARHAYAAAGNSYNLQLEGSQNYDACHELMIYVNQARAEAGVGPLTLDRELTDAAMQRAAEIAYSFSHTRPDGSRNQTVCASGRVWGENIAAGNSTAYATHKQWMNSPPHKKSLLMASHRGIGLGHFYHNGRHFWVQVFSSSVGYIETRTGIDNTIRNFQIVETGYPLKFIGHGSSKNMNYGDACRLQIGATNGGWTSATAAFRRYSFIWTSSNPSIVTVNNEGDIKAVGVGSARITAKTVIGNGSVSLLVKVTKDLCDSSVSSVPDMTYTGSPIRPSVTVTYQGTTLKEGKDYKVTYQNNVNAGRATILLEGCGEFTGSKSVNYMITPVNIEDASMVTLKDWNCGTADAYNFLSKNLIVTYGGKTLIQDQDYEIAYYTQKKSVQKITAYQIRFIGNYTGQRQGNCLDIGKFSYLSDQKYTGNPITPYFYVRYKESDYSYYEKEFVENTDYRTVYAQNIEAGTATITIYPLGDNYGQASTTFRIVYPPYSISFNANKGKTTIKSKSVVYGAKYGTLPKATRQGYTFSGWYTSATGGTKVTSATVHKKACNQNLYARWKKVTVNKSSLKSVKRLKSKTMKVTVKSVTGAKGYQVIISTSKKFTKNKKAITGTSKIKTFKKLKKTKYYVKVRAYKYDSAGKKVYGKWSSIKSIRIK